MSNKTFILKSLGCKQNALEGQIIIDELKNAGFSETDNVKKADIYILNSCSVTSHSDSQTNYLLNRAKRLNPEIKTVLTGCCAQTYKEHKDFNYSNIDLVLGNSEKLSVTKYINNLFENKSDGRFFVQDIMTKKDFENKFLLSPHTTRVSVKIQDGCNNRCSYCIIPYARGNSRSNTVDNIIEQINIIASKNIKEIVLTGIHIGQWGLEFNKTLSDLLKEIEKTSIPRYRLGSLYVNEIDDNMIEFLSKSEKFCPHFHLSLQSVCDKTLKNMNRFYCVKDVFKVVEKLHKNFKNPFLGCDIIVGFPYENDEDFTETYRNLEKLELSQIHCFPYSKRENTAAYNMPQVEDKIKTERAEKLTELSKKLHDIFLEKNKFETSEILIQKKDKDGFYSAITRNYIKIKFKDEDDNLRHTLKVVDLSKYELM